MFDMEQACRGVVVGHNLPSLVEVVRTSGRLGAADSRETSLVAADMASIDRRAEDKSGSKLQLKDL